MSLSVAVSSICPRSRGDAVLERIRALNTGLKVACDDLVLYNNLESYDNLEFQVVVRNLEIDEWSVNPANIAHMVIENICHNIFS